MLHSHSAPAPTHPAPGIAVLVAPALVPTAVLTVVLTVVLILALAALVGPVPEVRAATSEWAVNDQSRVRLVTPWEVAPAGDVLELGVHFEMIPGWHVYWKNSGDAGFPPAVEIEAPQGVEATLRWPAPERYELPGDLVAYGYEDEVVYPVETRLVPANTVDGAGPLVLEAMVDYLVCEIDCIPYRYTLRLEQPLAAEASAAVEDDETFALVERWTGRVPHPAGALDHLETAAGLDYDDPEAPALVVDVLGEPAEAPDGSGAQIFLEARDLYDIGSPERSPIPGGVRFRVPLEWRQARDSAPASLDVAWTVTGLAPAVAGAPPLALEARDEVTPGLPRTAAATTAREAGRPALLGLLASALVGGLALNLTPSGLALLLLGLAALGRRDADVPDSPPAPSLAMAALGGATAGAVALGLLSLGLRTGGGGAWSLQFQEPLALAGLALAHLLLALWLWGLWGRPVTADGAPVRPGAVAAGAALAVVLSLAWPLPLVPNVLEAALERGALTAIPVALALGVGLAAPFAAAAWASAAVDGPIRFFPRWSRRVAEALGFLPAVGVVWLLYVFANLATSERLAFLQLALLGVALAVWSRHRVRDRATAWRWGFTVLAAVAMVATLWVAGQAGTSSTDAAVEAPSATTTADAEPPGTDAPDPVR